MSPSPESERLLLVRLLVDAVEAVLRAGEDVEATRKATDARAWIAADEPDWPFSFATVCRTLGVDAAAMRTALLPSPSRRPPSRPRPHLARPRPPQPRR